MKGGCRGQQKQLHAQENGGFLPCEHEASWPQDRNLEQDTVHQVADSLTDKGSSTSATIHCASGAVCKACCVLDDTLLQEEIGDIEERAGVVSRVLQVLRCEALLREAKQALEDASVADDIMEVEFESSSVGKSDSFTLCSPMSVTNVTSHFCESHAAGFTQTTLQHAWQQRHQRQQQQPNQQQRRSVWMRGEKSEEDLKDDRRIAELRALLPKILEILPEWLDTKLDTGRRGEWLAFEKILPRIVKELFGLTDRDLRKDGPYRWVGKCDLELPLSLQKTSAFCYSAVAAAAASSQIQQSQHDEQAIAQQCCEHLPLIQQHHEKLRELQQHHAQLRCNQRNLSLSGSWEKEWPVVLAKNFVCWEHVVPPSLRSTADAAAAEVAGGAATVVTNTVAVGKTVSAVPHTAYQIDSTLGIAGQEPMRATGGCASIPADSTLFLSAGGVAAAVATAKAGETATAVVAAPSSFVSDKGAERSAVGQRTKEQLFLNEWVCRGKRVGAAAVAAAARDLIEDTEEGMLEAMDVDDETTQQEIRGKLLLEHQHTQIDLSRSTLLPVNCEEAAAAPHRLTATANDAAVEAAAAAAASSQATAAATTTTTAPLELEVTATWINGVEESGKPYDILIESRINGQRAQTFYIEVKATVAAQPFFLLSQKQIAFARAKPSTAYLILVVFNVRADAPAWTLIKDVSAQIDCATNKSGIITRKCKSSISMQHSSSSCKENSSTTEGSNDAHDKSTSSQEGAPSSSSPQEEMSTGRSVEDLNSSNSSNHSYTEEGKSNAGGGDLGGEDGTGTADSEKSAELATHSNVKIRCKLKKNFFCSLRTTQSIDDLMGCLLKPC